MTNKRKNIVIIGAGIHGITIALELAKQHNVSIIDSNDEILLGASNATHNRIHLGYHYPRSSETIEECKSGYNFFIKNYHDCLVFPEFFYIIEKESLLTDNDYKNIMIEHNLPCNEEFPKDCFLNKNYIKNSFKVNEACFDIIKFRNKIKKQLLDANINLYLNFNINSVSTNKTKITFVDKETKILVLNVDVLVNCTYTYSNNILKIFNIDDTLTEYEFEQTEIAVVESEQKIPAMTVMDGPFISILPYGNNKNLYLVYDVVNSVIKKEIGTYFTKLESLPSTNWSKMQSHGLKYYPFFDKLNYNYSLYSHRPIPKNNENDSRTTRIIKEKYPINFFSIKEGKFISAPAIAISFAKEINNND